MQVRWSPAAVEDLIRFVEHIRQENSPAAERIAKTIYESAGSLRQSAVSVTGLDGCVWGGLAANGLDGGQG